VPTAKYAKALRDEYGEAYRVDTVPKGTYKGLEADVPTVAVPNLLVVHEEMDEQLAHDLTALLFAQKKRLVAVHPEAKNLDPQRAQDVVEPVELHPGAERYYQEEAR
jgi:TRAP transporter TAXI family solute receptor